MAIRYFAYDDYYKFFRELDGIGAALKDDRVLGYVEIDTKLLQLEKLCKGTRQGSVSMHDNFRAFYLYDLPLKDIKFYDVREIVVRPTIIKNFIIPIRIQNDQIDPFTLLKVENLPKKKD